MQRSVSLNLKLGVNCKLSHPDIYILHHPRAHHTTEDAGGDVGDSAMLDDQALLYDPNKYAHLQV